MEDRCAERSAPVTQICHWPVVQDMAVHHISASMRSQNVPSVQCLAAHVQRHISRECELLDGAHDCGPSVQFCHPRAVFLYTAGVDI